MKKKVDKIKVYIQNRVPNFSCPTRQQFSTWAQAALISPQATEVTIRIVSSHESAALNQQYRQKTGPTNVLSFAYSSIPGEDDPVLGDLVICAELVAVEAQAENKTLLERWAHMVVHGLLHLQGYDHVELSAAKIMERLESEILQKLGFADPYTHMEKD